MVDYDEYSADNVFRHLLEPLYIDTPKPFGLKLALERRYPGLSIAPVTSTAQEWWKTADLRRYDGVVFAFGAPRWSDRFRECSGPAAGYRWSSRGWRPWTSEVTLC